MLMLLNVYARRSLSGSARRGPMASQITPVWFLLEDPTILIFSQPKKQKVRNIQQNPNVMLGLETRDYGDDVVLIEGTAELLDNNPNLGMSLPGYVEKYGKLMERMKITPEQIAAEYSQPIRI